MIDLEKFSSQANPEVIGAMREIASKEGRKLQHVLDEAMKDYIEKRNSAKPDKSVLKAFEESMEEYDSLYEELAK